jgi:hypothetical protein
VNDTTPHFEHREVAVASARAEAHEEMQIRRVDFRWIREDLERVDTPGAWLLTLASVMAGIAVTAFVAGLGFVQQRDAASGLSWAWLQPAYFSTAVFSAVFALTFFVLDRKQRAAFGADVQKVVRRMTEIEAMFPASVGSVGRAASGEGLGVERAEYGAQTTWSDVTDLVRAMVVDGALNFVVTNDALGGDPLKNVGKQLRISYRVGHTVDAKAFDEGTRVVLP